MSSEQWAVLMEENGKVHVVEMTSGSSKIKGLGVFDPQKTLSEVEVGGTVTIGQKELRRLPARLPELSKGMLRRAQTISAKDAGFFISRLGIGSGDAVLEGGIGSAGLSLHIARALGGSGIHTTVEPRLEHAEVGLENLRRAESLWQEFQNTITWRAPLRNPLKQSKPFTRPMTPSFLTSQTTLQRSQRLLNAFPWVAG